MQLNLTSLQAPWPVGTVLIACAGETIVAVDFTLERLARLLSKRFGRVEFAPSRLYAPELQAYLDGSLTALQSLPAEAGGTEFQRRVWHRLREIPPGQTRTYSQVAESIGQPRAARAVGLANSLNPLSLIVPCHRLIGRSGSLTGYAGGLECKRWLLKHESGGPC
ncbi:MAG: methylated-DNA--[protein]-cysteine S-methyltransferase [Candidatus Eremiobacteraeota bacterium]|nr:methylated-DNA--[protein]-cysteine S-methyltransferase [Candidatus Eremiobacteraeota bacterium]MCW5870090.1 methylated-DNA--[protein]-cysteine S-methyltransferase [Candidatus Eremiobacteraeota bacterium]